MHSSLLTLLFDMILGEPANELHPTVWMGAFVSRLERWLYRKDGRGAYLMGAFLVLLAVVSAGLAGLALERLSSLLLPEPFSSILVAAFASLSIACRSLAAHAKAPLRELCRFDIVAARRRLSMIVGRDTATLGRSEISRASVEAVAESLGDGIVAPLFLFALFGLPGAFIYRIANTMDSMLGHKDERYLRFGWAAARFDDLLNFIPARMLAIPSIGLAFAILCGQKSAKGAISSAIRFHASHKSPNAGWFESAFAGGLSIRLGGVNSYDGVPHEYPQMNPSAPAARPRHIKSAIRAMLLASLISSMLLDAIVMAASIMLR